MIRKVVEVEAEVAEEPMAALAPTLHLARVLAVAAAVEATEAKVAAMARSRCAVVWRAGMMSLLSVVCREPGSGRAL